MAKASPAIEKKETPAQFLSRNLRVAVMHLPEWDSKHMNHLEYRGIPIPIDGVYGWQSFLTFVHSWQPITDDSPDSGKNCLEWSTGLNLDVRDEKEVLVEMEKVLFLCHYLNALITNSKISVAWSKLGEDNQDKTEWLHESADLIDALKSLDNANQWKEVVQIGIKMRDLLRAMH